MNNIRNRNVRTIFGGIGIAMLLCVLMLLMSWSAVVQSSDINAIENQSTEDEKVNVDDISKFDIDDTQMAFNP
jgi:CHASE3 domain sensor protein